MGKNILVTGGFGFIGSHLVDRLLAQGHHVTVVDDLRSHVVSPSDYDDYVRRDQLRFLQIDAAMLSAYLLHRSVQEIYHLASPVGPVGVLAYAGQIVREVVDTTYAVVTIAKHYGAKLVDVSTSEVYGGGQQGRCAEDMPRIIQAETTVRLEYAVAKLAMETALINMTQTTPLDAVIVRPFNVAGPRQQAAGGFVVPRFVGQALRGEALTIYGSGTQVRAFTHVADIVEGLLLAMATGQRGAVYNLGNLRNLTTVNRLARLVQETVAPVGVAHVDPKALHGVLFAEAADKFPDPTKAADALGWQPRYGLTQIISDTRDDLQKTVQRTLADA